MSRIRLFDLKSVCDELCVNCPVVIGSVLCRHKVQMSTWLLRDGSWQVIQKCRVKQNRFLQLSHIV
jgi:hypothetical protein